MGFDQFRSKLKTPFFQFFSDGLLRDFITIFFLLVTGSGCTIDASILSSQSENWNLTIENPPSLAKSLTPFGNNFQIVVKDSKGQLVNSPLTATVEIVNDPTGSAELYGTKELPVINGVVDLTQLGIDLVGSGYQLKVKIGSREVITEPFDVSQADVEVKPFFPINGANFMDYVPQLPGLRIHEQVDQITTGSTIYFHGGEIRKVVLPTLAKCEELTLVEDLDLFHWHCNDEGSETFFYSRRFKEGKGLRDALLPNAFKSNKVLITKGLEVVASSALEVWWTNPVEPLNLNSGPADPVLTLTDSGIIYTVSAPGASRGISITGDRIGLVTMGESTVISNTASLVTGVCFNLDGVPCLITGKGKFGWLEVNASQNLVAKTINLKEGFLDASFWRVHNSNITATNTNFDADALYIDAKDTTITDSVFLAAGGAGVHHFFGMGVFADNLKITGGIAGGFRSHSWFVYLNRVQIFNSKGDGFNSSGFYKSILNSQIFNNQDSGVAMSTYASISIQNSLFVGNQNGGLNIFNDSYGPLMVVGNVVANNDISGMVIDERDYPNASLISQNYFEKNQNSLVLTDADNLTLSNNLIARSAGTAVVINGTSENLSWKGRLILDSNEADCEVTSTGVNPGLSNGTCDNQGASTATKITGVSTAGYLEGLQSDSVNQHGTATPILGSLIDDWSHFENRMRVWIDQLSGTLGICDELTDSCGIFDFSLKETAIEARFINGVVVNETCPNAYSGATELDAEGTYILPLAVEKIGDLIGNDNGLCESHEDCIIQQHIGANRDFERNDLQMCDFEEGAHLTGIRLYFAPD